MSLQFLANSQQENTNNYDSNEGVGFPGELFFQENAGKQQGNNANRGNDGGGNCTVAAQGVHISELAGGFKQDQTLPSWLS